MVTTHIIFDANSLLVDWGNTSEHREEEEKKKEKESKN